MKHIFLWDIYDRYSKVSGCKVEITGRNVCFAEMDRNSDTEEIFTGR